jgi:hypothetical protein
MAAPAKGVQVSPASPYGIDIVVPGRMMDAEFGSTTFVVLDVEMRGRSGGLVPATVAALALSGADFQPLLRVRQEIREERASFVLEARGRPDRLTNFPTGPRDSRC